VNLPTEFTEGYFKGKRIAHRFNDAWYIGLYKYTRQGRRLHGQRAVYYNDDGQIYFHRLDPTEYGTNAIWVVVRKVAIVENIDDE